MYVRRVFLKYVWSCLLAVLSLTVRGENKTYYTLNHEQGLKGSDVLQMTQLDDGRMVVVCQEYVNIYDGVSFRSVKRSAEDESVIEDYRGHTHLYVDGQQRLWIKNMSRVSCLDLRTLCFVPRCDSLFLDFPAKDLFVDTDRDMWLVDGRCVMNRRTGLTLALPADAGDVQDVEVHEKRVYVFTHYGQAVVFDASSARLLAVCPAYDRSQRPLFDRTSLVVRTSDGRFCQLRVGTGGSVFLCFDPQDMAWSELLRSDSVLHTLVVTAARIAYITTSGGYIVYNLRTHSHQRLESLRLPDGSMLATGFNTVCRDREGGIWLGSYHRGVFYSSPLSGMFDTREESLPLAPVLLSVYLHGRRMDVRRGELPEDAPYVQRLEFGHDDNDLTFLFSAMKFVHPRSVCYRYRVQGLNDDDGWHTASADSVPDVVDDSGRLRLSFVGLPPGEYALEVMASADAGLWRGALRRIEFAIRPPWWATTAACAAWAVLLAGLLALGVWLYVRRLRRRAERKSREDMLLLRIQDLIEKCNQYESAVNVVLADPPVPEDRPAMSPSEVDFLNRATALVQQNLSNPSYSVEQLSRDICMERSGLYKRLTSILDKSPVAFIRTIRLRRAVELLQDGGMTVAEVAEATGFASPGYFSKCFQKEFGCKPSEYVRRPADGKSPL